MTSALTSYVSLLFDLLGVTYAGIGHLDAQHGTHRWRNVYDSGRF